MRRSDARDAFFDLFMLPAVIVLGVVALVKKPTLKPAIDKLRHAPRD